MTINTPSDEEVKAQLRRIRRSKSSSQGKSGKGAGSGPSSNTADLQEIVSDLPESTCTDEQDDRGEADSEDDLENRNDLLNGKL